MALPSHQHAAVAKLRVRIEAALHDFNAATDLDGPTGGDQPRILHAIADSASSLVSVCAFVLGE